MRRIAIVGAGGHGKIVCDAIIAAAMGDLIGFVDDDPDRLGVRVLGLPVLGSLDRVGGPADVVLAMGIGDNAARRRVFEWVRALGFTVVTVQHPAAIVARECVVGDGAVLLARVTVNAGTRVGENAILNTACSVDHDCEIGAHAHVAPGSTLTGNVVIGEGTLVGAGCVAIPGIRIGAGSIVGAGSVVVTDLPPGCVARGVPARVMRAVDDGARS